MILHDEGATPLFDMLNGDTELCETWMDGLAARARLNESDPDRAPPFRLAEGCEAGVYRCLSILSGMATYYIVTHAGQVHRDELHSVRPDTMREIEIIAQLSERFRDLRPMLHCI